MKELISHYWAFEIFLTLSIPIFLLANRFEKRRHFGLRFALSMCTLAAIALFPIELGIITGLNEREAFLTFTVLLAYFALLIIFCYRCSIWQALFCATAGYTIQNLLSGLIILSNAIVTHSNANSPDDPLYSIIRFVVYGIIFGASYLYFIRSITNSGVIYAENKLMLAMFVVVALVIIGLDIVIKGATNDGISHRHLIELRLLHAMLCSFVLFTEYELLYGQRAREERQKSEEMLKTQERQYQLSRNNIDALNIKVHDLRHQIHHFANENSIDKDFVTSLNRELDIFNSVVKTGNEALDLVLTEKSLAASSENISLTCIADGSLLSFMRATDIYSLFGNALENALEATRKVENQDSRNINFSVLQRGEMVAISIENYYIGRVVFADDGLPLSSKGDTQNHGFGTRSIKQIVEHYDGSLSAGVDGSIFYLNILLPME